VAGNRRPRDLDNSKEQLVEHSEEEKGVMGEKAAEQQTAEELRTEIKGSLALVTLDRRHALNALTTAMRARLSQMLWSAARDPNVYAVALQSTSGKVFSAGSDVREVIAWGRSDRARARRAFQDEYALNWQCECFSKPTIPLIDGLVMGGGVGITMYGTHRVAGERYRFAMPETQIGLFPDIGICHVLARLAGAVGMYLGLTGRAIGRADAFALGLVTHCIDARHFEDIKTEVADAWPVDPALDDRHRDPGPGEIAAHAAVLAHCFSAPTVEGVLARLGAVDGPSQAWAEGVVTDLKARSPLSLKITQRHIRHAKARDLRETLQVDYRLACRCLDGHDFYEGVRAALIDKDARPMWRPDRLEDVTEAMIEAYFAPMGADELTLPTRQEMQEARS
jgi:enoyl-CoA hydratase